MNARPISFYIFHIYYMYGVTNVVYVSECEQIGFAHVLEWIVFDFYSLILMNTVCYCACLFSVCVSNIVLCLNPNVLAISARYFDRVYINQNQMYDL